MTYFDLHEQCLTDVVSIAKTGENFRLLYDNKGRFTLHSISLEEAKVQKKPFIVIESTGF